MKLVLNNLWNYIGVLFALVLFSQVSLADSVGKGQWSFSTVNGVIDSQEVVIKITGLSADADLYVRKGVQPSLTAFECRPELTETNAETCIIPLANGEIAHVGVYGAEAADFEVEHSFLGNTQTDPNAISITLGRVIPGTVQSNQFTYYVFDSSVLPALTDDFLVSSDQNFDGFGVEFVAHLTGMNADADLYIGIGELPTVESNQCRSEQGLNNAETVVLDEQCGVFLKELDGQPIYVGVIDGKLGANDDGVSPSYNVQALIQKTINISPNNIPLVPESNTIATGEVFSTSARIIKGQWHYYRVNPFLVAEASSVSVTMQPLESDVDLYIRSQAPPIALHWDCFANQSGTTTEVCTINNPHPNQAFYFGVFGFSTSNYSVSVVIQPK